MSGVVSQVSIIGLPGSGKTTLLAALWHLVREEGAVTALSFDRLSRGNYEHLNALAKRWRAGKIQQRTQQTGMKTVEMRLKDSDDASVDVAFPDIPGEEFSRMWEAREIEEEMTETLRRPALVLLVNGDTIQYPAWVVERMAIAQAAGLGTPAVKPEPVDWSPELAPTQVQVVELLQMLMSDQLGIGPRRLAILISAWDKVAAEELEPEAFLKARMPLVDQYLRSGRDRWMWRVWGVSAQGGVYEDADKGEHFQETETIRELERPSDRIRLVDGDTQSSDITKPIHWLIRE
ncbi:TRAFAC clade GTPase domain-containing protein [Brevundimonas pondensis]|uniref:Double-GTPase 1 domain-containing protein n=1 Tax=Brevundimonas pondensis TaxID=2774189 RepID=A0ABX7SRX3_9CAUL|nr:hypothetical protein [Brevundimonas pondensis]QTC89193.1 hypothetical protein IFE19_07665 [Brevundimonas pondensis]